ncbi:MAG: PLP-dependent aminotransferase family protein [Verrucomicrobiota bacterium]
MNRIKTDSTIHFSQLGHSAEPPVIVELMNRALMNPELLSLAAGFTDNAVLPGVIVAEICREIALNEASRNSLQYGQNQGRARLRELTCEWLGQHPGERLECFSPEEVFITNGSQQALYLAMQTLCDPGDIVLVEEPSYFVCLEVLKGLGIRPIGIPCDQKGAIRMDGFRELISELKLDGQWDRVKALYLVSYFGNPSSRSMQIDEKKEVAEILLEADALIPVIEDAAYRELYFDAPHPAPSILSLGVYEAFPKLYLGTYTKPFATGLKVGYGYCSHANWREKMLCIKGHQDFGTAHFNQVIVERALEQGHYASHLELLHTHYRRKADIMDAALRQGGLAEAGWFWEKPKGGLIFWLRGPDSLDTRMESPFCQSCIDSGMLYVPGDLCFSNGTPWNFIRLSTGSLPGDGIEEAVKRFASVATQQAFTAALL